MVLRIGVMAAGKLCEYCVRGWFRNSTEGSAKTSCQRCDAACHSCTGPHATHCDEVTSSPPCTDVTVGSALKGMSGPTTRAWI